MSSFIEIQLKLTNEKMRFEGKAKDNPAVVLDSQPPFGDGDGYSSMELLLISLASCSSATAVSILRKMKKQVHGFFVLATGEKRMEHPMVFDKISLQFILESDDTSEEELAKVLARTEEKYCPVWAMLKDSVRIVPEHTIRRG
ncbi:MAG: OsmC family protein [Clostridia bacterium]